MFSIPDAETDPKPPVQGMVEMGENPEPGHHTSLACNNLSPTPPLGRSAKPRRNIPSSDIFSQGLVDQFPCGIIQPH